jgi:hypothetical protein
MVRHDHACATTRGGDCNCGAEISDLHARLSTLEQSNAVMVAALREIEGGYGPNHLSKFARDVAGKALAGQTAEVVCVKQEHLQTLLDMAETHRAQMPTRSPTLRAQEDEAFQAVRALLEGGKQSHG